MSCNVHVAVVISDTQDSVLVQEHRTTMTHVLFNPVDPRPDPVRMIEDLSKAGEEVSRVMQDVHSKIIDQIAEWNRQLPDTPVDPPSS